MSDKEKAIFLSIALAAFETVRDAEGVGSSRKARLNKAIDKILELVDIYRTEAWPVELVSRAAALVDSFNERIAEEFGQA